MTKSMKKGFLSSTKSWLSSFHKSRPDYYERLLHDDDDDDHHHHLYHHHKQEGCKLLGNNVVKDETTSRKRMHNEMKIKKFNDGDYHCSYGALDENDPFTLQAVIIGPPDTPFEAGVFFLTIHIPSIYPFKVPLIKFQTKVFHPNVGSDGTIYVDILRENWSPALTVHKLLLSICSFLADPNHSPDGCNPVCDLYWNNRHLYNQIARQWTLKYATL